VSSAADTRQVHRTSVDGRRPFMPDETSTGRFIRPTAQNVMHPTAIDEDNTTQYTKVIHASTTSALWKIRPKPLHLRLSQPIQIAHDILQQLGIVNHGNATSSTR
jgi:hypothetical protein